MSHHMFLEELGIMTEVYMFLPVRISSVAKFIVSLFPDYAAAKPCQMVRLTSEMLQHKHGYDQ